MIFFRHCLDVGKPSPCRGQQFVRAGILKSQHIEISLLLPADTDHFGPVIRTAGGDGVVQGIGKEYTQVKIIDPAGLWQNQGHLCRNLLRKPQLLPQQNIHHRITSLIREGQGFGDDLQLFQGLPAFRQFSASKQPIQARSFPMA